MAAKARARVEARWALVATKGGGVLVGQRRAELRFGGLWEPPSLERIDGEAQADAVRRLEALTGARLARVTKAGEVVHVLSHRRLEVVVLRATLGRLSPVPRREPGSPQDEYTRFEFASLDALGERGVSTLARKVLRAGVR